MFNLSNTTHASGYSCLYFKVNFDLTPELFTAHVITLVVNSLTAFTAFVGNLLILITVLRTRSLHSPSNVLLCCLSLSDLLVGLIAQPCFVGHKIGELTNNFRIYCVTRVVAETAGFITVGVSTLTLTAISVEKYLALKLHLRYREIITCKKVLYIAGSFWVLLFILGGLRFVVYGKLFEAAVVSVLLLILSLTPWCYYHIFKIVKRHENQIKVQSLTPKRNYESTEPKTNRHTGTRKIIKHKKSTIAMMYILGVFLICYVPTLIVQTAILLKGYTRSAKIAYVYISTLLLVNSSINPAIYCWRMSEIRRAVRATISKVVPSIEPEESTNYTIERSGVEMRSNINSNFMTSRRGTLERQ